MRTIDSKVVWDQAGIPPKNNFKSNTFPQEEISVVQTPSKIQIPALRKTAS